LSLTPRGGERLRVYEKRMLRRILGPMREKVAGSWKRLYNEELSNLYTSPSIITVMKSRTMRWQCTQHEWER